jgi:hypothetical protein
MSLSEQAGDPSNVQKDIDGMKSGHAAAGSNAMNGHETVPQALEAKAPNETIQDNHKVSPSEEKTANDMSKQATQVEASLAGKQIDDDSSSSSSSDDDSDDFPQTKAPAPVAKKEVDP